MELWFLPIFSLGFFSVTTCCITGKIIGKILVSVGEFSSETIYFPLNVTVVSTKGLTHPRDGKYSR